MIGRAIVPCLSKKPRKRSELRFWCLGFQKSNERELLVRVKVLWLLIEAAEQKYQSRLWCRFYQRSLGREKKKIIKDFLSWLLLKSRNKNISQGYGEAVFVEAAKKTFQLGLWCRSILRSLEREIRFRAIVSQLSIKMIVSQGNCRRFLKSCKREMLRVLTFAYSDKQKCQLGLFFRRLAQQSGG